MPRMTQFEYEENERKHGQKSPASYTHAPGIATNPGIRWKETRTVITGPVVGNLGKAEN